MKKKEITERLGYEPSGPQKKMILERMKVTGEPIEETIDKFSLPPMVFPDKDGIFDLDGEKMTRETFKTKWPGRRFIAIGIF